MAVVRSEGRDSKEEVFQSSKSELFRACAAIIYSGNNRVNHVFSEIWRTVKVVIDWSRACRGDG